MYVCVARRSSSLRLVALTTFYFLWIRNPGRGQPPFLWPSILQNFDGALYVHVARRSSSRNLAAGRKRGRRSWQEVGGQHTLVGGTSLVVPPWRLENLSEMLRNLAPQGQVAGIRFIDKVSRMIKMSTKQASHSSLYHNSILWFRQWKQVGNKTK